MPNEEMMYPLDAMQQIRTRLIAMGYYVRSSISNSRMLYATNDTKGELHAVILEGKDVRVNDINGRHKKERKEIEREVKQCLNQ